MSYVIEHVTLESIRFYIYIYIYSLITFCNVKILVFYEILAVLCSSYSILSMLNRFDLIPKGSSTDEGTQTYL